MIAIAIALLVLDMHVPEVHSGLAEALCSQWPHYAAYAVSFLTIGIIWVNHHALFERIGRVDRMLFGPIAYATALVVALVSAAAALALCAGIALYFVRPVDPATLLAPGSSDR